MIAVTFALPAESSAFLRRVNSKSWSRHQGIKVIYGKIDDCAVEVLHTGVGEKTCRQRMGKFLLDRQFNCLISAGFAGALTDQLHVGDLLLAKNFSTVNLSGNSKSLSGLPIQTGGLLTVPSIIDSGEERQKIAQTTGAAAIDMETEFIAWACAEHGISLLSLRAISDTPSEPLPAPTNVLFDIDRQRTHARRLATFFLAHPNRIPRLMAFAKRIAHARETLADAIVALLRSIE